METNTENYNLRKPDATEFYDVGVQNGNMDILDTELKKNADGVSQLNNSLSKETSERKSTMWNPNIGINCDFRKRSLVNQRNLKEYINIGTCTIDMWKKWFPGTLTINDDGIILQNISTENSGLVQYFEADTLKHLLGKKITISIEIDELITTIVGTILVESGKNYIEIKFDWGIYQFAYNHTENIWYIYILVYPNKTTPTINRCKIELGAVSTLANDPPQDYGTELAKCQRYYETNLSRSNKDVSNAQNAMFYEEAKNVLSGFNFKVTKRITPTVRIYSSENLTPNKVTTPFGAESAYNIVAILAGVDGVRQLVCDNVTQTSTFFWEASAEL